MDQITLNPDTHNQRTVARCVVGWTVKLADGSDRLVRDFGGGFYRPEIVHRAAHLLGISYETAENIFDTMNNEKARRKLEVLIDAEVKRREIESRAAKKVVKAAAKQTKKDAKRQARIEEETQQALDLQAREQVSGLYSARQTSYSPLSSLLAGLRRSLPARSDRTAKRR